MRVVVTGGCGFIGSHQVVSLLDKGHKVLIVDDLSNSKFAVLDRIKTITDHVPQFAKIDVLATDRLSERMDEFSPDAVIHFAGRKHVRESVHKPFDYYYTNVLGLLSVLDASNRVGVRSLVFSSSGSIYGETDLLPISESAPRQPTNPYSRTKLMCEHILEDVCSADPTWAVAALRYFNPAGAHPSGQIGEDPNLEVSNLLPVLMHIAVGNRDKLRIYGDDFNTPDGSGVRDYVHVMDVANSHLRALDVLQKQTGFSALNIGRGHGVSVFELVAAVQRVTGVNIPIEILPRRTGDVSSLYGSTELTAERLGQISYQSIDTICEDAWRWQTKNPTGYPV